MMLRLLYIGDYLFTFTLGDSPQWDHQNSIVIYPKVCRFNQYFYTIQPLLVFFVEEREYNVGYHRSRTRPLCSQGKVAAAAANVTIDPGN